MRKFSRHHAYHAGTGSPIVEIDVTKEDGSVEVLYQEGVGSHPLAGKYTADQIQVIEFLNNLLFKRAEPILTEDEINYMLYTGEAHKPRDRYVAEPAPAPLTAQPKMFQATDGIIVFHDQPEPTPAVVENVSLDGSAYPVTPVVETPEPVVPETPAEPIVATQTEAIPEPVVPETPADPMVATVTSESTDTTTTDTTANAAPDTTSTTTTTTRGRKKSTPTT